MLQIALELSNGFDMNSVKLIIAALALVVLDVHRVDSRLHDGGNNNNYTQRMETLTSKLISSIGIDKVPDYKNVSLTKTVEM